MSLRGDVITHSGVLLVCTYGSNYSRRPACLRETANFYVDTDTGLKYRKDSGRRAGIRNARARDKLEIHSVRPIQ